MLRHRLLAGLALCALAGTAQAAVTYTITDLGTLGGAESFAFEINDAGQVAGRAQAANGRDHAFLYANGVMNDLGVAGGDVATASSQGFGLNDAGQVVGSALKVYATPVLWSGGAATELGSQNGLLSAADINNAGQIVGYGGGGFGHAMLYENGAVTDLGTLGGQSSRATAINDSGVIVGYAAGSLPGGTADLAFVYVNGTMTSLGSLNPEGGSQAFAVNEGGQIAGSSYFAPGDARAFLYANGAMLNLGTLGGLGSSGWGINDAGFVVGSSGVVGGGSHAFLYQGGPLLDLNELIDPAAGWVLTRAEDINNVGQIIGSGLMNGQQHAFLLTQIEGPAPGVPEPSIWLMLVAGFGLAGGALRRGRADGRSGSARRQPSLGCGAWFARTMAA